MCGARPRVHRLTPYRHDCSEYADSFSIYVYVTSTRRALGVSLFAMLTGAPPFVGDTLMATCAPQEAHANAFMFATQHGCMLLTLAALAHARSYEMISAAPLELPPSLEGTPGARATASKAGAHVR